MTYRGRVFLLISRSILRSPPFAARYAMIPIHTPAMVATTPTTAKMSLPSTALRPGSASALRWPWRNRKPAKRPGRPRPCPSERRFRVRPPVKCPGHARIGIGSVENNSESRLRARRSASFGAEGRRTRFRPDSRKQPTPSNPPVTICHSCRYAISDFTVSKQPEHGIRMAGIQIVERARVAQRTDLARSHGQLLLPTLRPYPNNRARRSAISAISCFMT